MLERAKQLQQSSTVAGLAAEGLAVDPPVSADKHNTVFTQRFFSPSASPSAGILRKRHLTQVAETESPSPPNKVSTDKG